VADLKEMIDQNNVYVDSFRSHGLTVQQDVTKEYKLRLISNRPKDGRMYNLPTSSEATALVPGDFETNPRDRYIIVESRVGKLKRISFFSILLICLFSILYYFLMVRMDSASGSKDQEPTPKTLDT
jgi:hypothetical protein